MENMERKKLANEVTDFCFEHRVFNTVCGIEEIKKRIEEQFEDVIFVEGLINMIIVRTRDKEDIDTGSLIDVLVELEKLRLELEYKDRGAKC